MLGDALPVFASQFERMREASAKRPVGLFTLVSIEPAIDALRI